VIDWLNYPGVEVPRRKNKTWRRGFRTCYVDPPETDLMRIEDDSVIRVIMGKTCPSIFINTQLGSIMEMPGGNRPERGLTCES